MSKSLRCSELYSGCDFIIHGSTDDEVIALTVQHARDKHGLREVDWALMAKLASLIRTENERAKLA